MKPIRFLQLSSVLVFLILKFYFGFETYTSILLSVAFLGGTFLLEYLMDNNWVWIPRERSFAENRFTPPTRLTKDDYFTPQGFYEN